GLFSPRTTINTTGRRRGNENTSCPIPCRVGGITMNENNKPNPPIAWNAVLLTQADLEKLLQLSGKTISRLVARHEFPQPVRLGFSKRWRVKDISRYLETGATESV